MIARFIDGKVFPAIKVYAAHRLHILFALGLLLVVLNPWMPLVIQVQAGNYLNVVSGTVACIILAEEMRARVEERDVHKRLEVLQDSHDRLHGKHDELLDTHAALLEAHASLLERQDTHDQVLGEVHQMMTRLHGLTGGKGTDGTPAA